MKKLLKPNDNCIYFIDYDQKINHKNSQFLKQICINDFLKHHPHYDDIIIKRYPMEKPYAKTQRNQKINLSISHTTNYFVMCFSHIPCGIDIELSDTKRYKKTIHRFFTAQENELLMQMPELFSKIWTIKESYVKLLGIGILKGYNLINSVSSNETSCLIKQKGNCLFYTVELCQELVCTLAVYQPFSSYTETPKTNYDIKFLERKTNDA